MRPTNALNKPKIGSQRRPRKRQGSQNHIQTGSILPSSLLISPTRTASFNLLLPLARPTPLAHQTRLLHRALLPPDRTNTPDPRPPTVPRTPHRQRPHLREPARLRTQPMEEQLGVG